MNYDLIIPATITGVCAATPPTIMAVLAWQTAKRSVKVMEKVEVNTNSMSERLGASALAQGKAEGRAEGAREERATKGN